MDKDLRIQELEQIVDKLLDEIDHYKEIIIDLANERYDLELELEELKFKNKNA